MKSEEKKKKNSNKDIVYASSINPSIHSNVLIEKADRERRDLSSRIVRLIYFFTSLANILLLLRFVFELSGATDLGIVDLVYQLTYPLVLPFVGLFGIPVYYSNGKFEIESLFAILVVTLMSFIVVTMVRLLTGTEKTHYL